MTAPNLVSNNSDLAVDNQQQLDNNRLMFLLVQVVLTMFFGCLIYANFMVRSAQGQWPPVGINRMDITTPALMTAVLVLSSITAIIGVQAFKRGNNKTFLGFLTATFLFGVVYVAVMLNLFLRMPFTGVYSAMFLALWVVHVIHAVAGLIFLGYVLRATSQGKLSAKGRFWPVESSTGLWHFLTGVWIVLFIVLYFV